MDSLCHPWFTTTNLSYRFPIFETSATALCGTTGIHPYTTCQAIEPPSPNDHLRSWISKMQGFFGLLAGFEGYSHWSDWFCDSRLAAWVSSARLRNNAAFKQRILYYYILYSPFAVVSYTVFDQILSQLQVSTAAHFRVVPPVLSNFQLWHHFPTPTAPLGQAGPVSLRPTRRSCSEAPRGPSCWTHPVTALPEPKVEAATATASKPGGVFNGVCPRCLEKTFRETSLTENIVFSKHIEKHLGNHLGNILVFRYVWR